MTPARHRAAPSASAVVDTHTHLLPDRLARKVRAYFEARIPGALVYPLDHDIVLGRLAAAGVGTAWCLPYAHRPGVARWLNPAMAAVAAEGSRGPVTVIGGATVHPGDEDPRGVVLDAWDTLGLAALKLHASVGEYEPDDPRLAPVWSAASQRRRPVVVHVGRAVTGHTGAAELAAVDRVARAWPQARLIVAHSAHPAGAAAMALLSRHEHVYLDLAPVVTEPVWLPPDLVRAHAERLLFATDAPNVGITAEDQLAGLSRFGLSDADLAAVTGGNARRLLAEAR